MVELPVTAGSGSEESDTPGREPVARPQSAEAPQLDLEELNMLHILRALRTCTVLGAEETAVSAPYAAVMFNTILGDTDIANGAMEMNQAAIHVEAKIESASTEEK